MRRHPLDAFSLVLGLLAVAGTGAWVAWREGVVTTDELALAGPIALIVIGVVGVAASFLKHVPSRTQTEDRPEPSPGPDHEGASR